MTQDKPPPLENSFFGPWGEFQGHGFPSSKEPEAKLECQKSLAPRTNNFLTPLSKMSKHFNSLQQPIAALTDTPDVLKSIKSLSSFPVSQSVSQSMSQPGSQSAGQSVSQSLRSRGWVRRSDITSAGCFASLSLSHGSRGQVAYDFSDPIGAAPAVRGEGDVDTVFGGHLLCGCES